MSTPRSILVSVEDGVVGPPTGSLPPAPSSMTPCGSATPTCGSAPPFAGAGGAGVQYMDRIWARLLRESPRRKTLPAIIPHHGVGGWRGPRALHGMIEGLHKLPELRRFVPNFDLLIDDLSLATDAQLIARPLNSAPKVATWLLRDGRNVPYLCRLATGRG
jgi:hypothetical protein